MNSTISALPSGWHVYGADPELQKPFDVAVVMPTIGRDSILEAISSVYAQENVGRIQLLIGVDAPLGVFTRVTELLNAAPDHVTSCLFYPGYSTSARHGGLHPARDGGALRSTLSYLANSRYIAYLDDDNWWAPQHLNHMLNAIAGREWAFSLRWFVHPESRQPVCVDDWESVGPGRGDFKDKFGGWVDPNCLMIDKLACEPVLRWWSIPLPGDSTNLSSDRHVYDWLQKKSAPGESRIPSVYYTMQPKDGIHPYRLQHMGARYDAANTNVKESLPRLTAITTCKGRLHHLQKTLPLLASQLLTDVIVVDYGCPQGTAAWVTEHYPKVKVIKVSDDPDFSLARARNIGAKAAATPWLLFVDADVMVESGFDEWLGSRLDSKAFYRTQAYGTDLTGSFFCTRQSFENIGGYDEAIRGWGGEDDDLYFRLLRAGLQQRHYPDQLFSFILHSDEERFAVSGETNRQIQWMLNQWYRCIKYDVMSAWGRDLSIEERLIIRKLVTDAVHQATQDGNPNSTELFVELGERTDIVRFTGAALRRKLVYSLVGRNIASSNTSEI